MEQNGAVEANIKDFQRTGEQAKAVNDALNHLLDLNQKYANISEARAARKQAEATSKQGDTMLVFTIVTIVFVRIHAVNQPLSKTFAYAF
ncbi:Similar to hypothetical protein AN6960.2 [Aspergillus nidulans FGSC A4]; acc. no. XP_664564 [Pyronema omphalodes CBS 100304]|uniref:Uncharacterized protein n=1 Tax=Pyronema omphalodes (strain CBS 100304) TaxID=1076935 RepID=U4LB86_PYROM|nr:Similar to hypothetical protein AN6960.2 [Aspergillus nidulans FGSC A4]; acc. no. XP_664564 [Pyronema omphalodes CBS 100304]